MKKFAKFAVTSATVIASLASTVAPTMAATVDSKDSVGHVSFQAPETGALTLVQVSDLEFGNHEISLEDQTYKNENEGNAQVQDLRGSSAGWKVQVTQTDDFKNGTNVLNGAAITLNGQTDNGTVAVADASLVSGTTVDVWSAAKGTGDQLSNYAVAKDSSSLMVPGKTKKVAGDYTTNLKWELSDGVANN